MKCVKTANGSIMLLKDMEAAKLVDNIDYHYCPKWEWKDQEGKSYKGERLGGE